MPVRVRTQLISSATHFEMTGRENQSEPNVGGPAHHGEASAVALATATELHLRDVAQAPMLIDPFARQNRFYARQAWTPMAMAWRPLSPVSEVLFSAPERITHDRIPLG